MRLKSRIVLLCGVVLSLIFMGIGRAETPTTQAFLTADQKSALIAANGKAAVVEGTVEDIEDASENVMRMTFKEAPQNSFVGIVFSKKTPKVHDYFEGPDGSALVGKKIDLHGTISLFHGDPEIVITDQKQVEIIEAAATQPG